MEQPGTGRLRWQHLGSTVCLRLRAPWPWQLVIGPAFFLGLLLSDNPWSRAVRPLLAQQDWAFPGLLFPLVFGIVLLLQLGAVLWQLFSQEILVVRRGSVEIRRQVLGQTFFRRQLEASDLTLVEVRENASTAGRGLEAAIASAGFKGGTLLFSTAGGQVAFGRGLDPAEARAALHELVALRALPANILSFS
jgi:hypothetical protein